MSHVVKVILKIVLGRNEDKIEGEIRDSQSGFRAGMGTREGIFNLRTILDRYLEVKQDIFICYIDYEKAFDRVYHEKLIRALKKLPIDITDLKLIENLYWNLTASIGLEQGESNDFEIKLGVRQGCVLSPKLFNLCAEEIFQRADELPGINIGGTNITNLRYADDTALLAESEEALQAMVNVVREESLVRGLKMNVKKTKSVVVSRTKIDKFGNNSTG